MIALHVVFKVGAAEFVLPAAEVTQMESFTTATPVPGTSGYVAGLVQVRGQVIPVIDLRVRFGLPPQAPTIDTRVIVVRDGARTVALLADSAREVVRLDTESFEAPPSVVSAQARGFVAQVARLGPRLLLRVDVSKIIAPPKPPQEEDSHAHLTQTE